MTPPKTNVDLQNEIRLLAHQVKKQNSYVHKFLLGVVSGLGTAIGATIVASILILILSFFVRSIEDIPILKNIIESIQLDQLVSEDN